MSAAERNASQGAAEGPRLLRALDAFCAALSQALEDALDRAADRRRAAILLVLGAALLCALPGLTTLPPTDRDEARFIQASRQMLDSGDPIDIRFQDEPRWKKPAGIYWAQSISVLGAETLGVEGARRTPAAFRLPSLAGAVGGALALLWTLTPVIGRRAATLAAMMLGGCVIVAAEATIAKTDAALLAVSVLSMGAYVRLLALSRSDAGDVARADFRRLSLLFWGLIGAGALLKGPIILIPPFGAALALSLVEKRLRPFEAMGWRRGPLLALAIAAPWYIAIGIQSHGDFFQEALMKDMVGKVVEGKESHGAPPGTYAAVFWAIFWPWAPVALAMAPAIWAARRRPPVLFLLAWATPTWIVFELAPTKLPHYVMPALPAVAGLLALSLQDAWREGALPRWRRILPATLSGIVGFGLALALIVGPGAVQWRHGLALSPLTAALAAGLGLIGGAFTLGAVRALARGRPAMALAPSFCAAVALFWGALHVGLPAMQFGFPSVQMAAASAPVAACTGIPAASGTYREPSLVFLQGRNTRFVSEPEAAALLAETPGASVWIEDRRAAEAAAAFAEAGVTPRELASVAAFNPNRGKTTTLRLLAAAADPTLAACGL